MAKKKIEEEKPSICWTVSNDLVTDFEKEADGYSGFIGDIKFYWNKEGKRSDGLYSPIDLEL
jgi:hypothetical protein